ncbi:MAG TPA: hypothetical protein VGR45_01770 [Stellaceae bacterium]|nr:hypothetical protein [Stellaceae bacterium]
MSALPSEPELFAGLPQRVQPLAVEFAAWWRAYPHKVDKGHAEKAFVKARRIASLEELLAGVQRYIRDKRQTVPWCNPATWLNGKRWLDEPADVGPMAAPGESVTPLVWCSGCGVRLGHPAAIAAGLCAKCRIEERKR